MTRLRLLHLAVAAALSLGIASGRADPAADEQVLRAAKVGIDGPALLEFLRLNTPAHLDPALIEPLIRQLGSEDFVARERALRDVVRLGPRAAAYLRQALKDPDPELARRARHCLAIIDAGPGPEVQAAAVRLVGQRKPAGAAAVLLAYLPYAPNKAVTREIVRALPAVSVADGKPDPAIIAALDDKLPARRLAAAEALIRVGQAGPAAKFLHDADPRVRRTIALLLVEHKDKKAVPVLIELLAQLPADQIGPIEDILYRLAGEDGPSVRLGSDAGPQQIRAVWAEWWKRNEAKVDLGKLHVVAKVLGHTLIVSAEAGRILEIDISGKVLWQVEGLSHPLTAQVIGADRLLVAEYRGMRVTERNFKGTILWEKKIAWPVAAQRFADGHRFIATRNQVLELDKDGKEIYVHTLPGQILMGAQKLRNGHIGCLTSAGVFVLLDPKGKEVRRLQVGSVNFGSGFAVLANGNVLVPEYRANQVVEWDAQGKKVWSVAVPSPQAAVRLANGNTLIASAGQRRVLEVDPAGRRVWEYALAVTPARVQRR